jgi:hypothetical protein
MEPEFSLPHSQLPATFLYPEPAPSSPHAWVSPLVSFPQVSPQKPCTRLSPPHPSYMPQPSYSSRFYHPHDSGWGVQIMMLLIMKFSPLPCYLVHLRPKYSPQHPIFKHPQSTLLSQCQRPCFTPIQNNRQSYISVYLNLHSIRKHS